MEEKINYNNEDSLFEDLDSKELSQLISDFKLAKANEINFKNFLSSSILLDYVKGAEKNVNLKFLDKYFSVNSLFNTEKETEKCFLLREVIISINHSIKNIKESKDVLKSDKFVISGIKKIAENKSIIQRSNIENVCFPNGQEMNSIVQRNAALLYELFDVDDRPNCMKEVICILKIFMFNDRVEKEERHIYFSSNPKIKNVRDKMISRIENDTAWNWFKIILSNHPEEKLVFIRDESHSFGLGVLDELDKTNFNLDKIFKLKSKKNIAEAVDKIRVFTWNNLKES